ncbi:MAG: NB-ARC domain-containing protein [Cyanobacteria bacterium J06642_2]
MDVDAALAWLNELAIASQRESLSELQQAIVQHVWQGKTYGAIAALYGCTEGHAKDVGAELWQWLSRALDERVSKRSLKAVLERAIAAQTEPGGLAQRDGWVGRERDLAQLDALAGQGAKAIVIQGEGGIGKTAIAQRYFQQRPFDCVLELMMAKELQNLTSVESVVEEWLLQDFGLEPGREFGVTLSRLQRQLRQQRVGILIDNLEPALDERGQFVAPHRRYLDLLRVLTGPQVRSLTLITSRDRLCEADVLVEHVRLSGLTLTNWEQYGRAARLSICSESLAAMHRDYGGNAKALGLLCGTIRADWEGDVAAYWREVSRDPLAATDLRNLIDAQLQRLAALDANAYRLLCRLSCFRYQDIPSIPTAGAIALLWDVPEQERQRILSALRYRSTVEHLQGRYWLHPAMRAAAIHRLRASSDWEETHRRAADYWTQSVDTLATRADALQVLEAFYHYVAISDFSRAGAILVQSRNNPWQQYLSLGGILYRLGLVRPLMSAATLAIEQLKDRDDDTLGELYNLLGDTHWIAGDIHRAIAAQTRALHLAERQLEQSEGADIHRRAYCEISELDSLLSLGLYALDLWELSEAAAYFQRVINLAGDRQRDRWTNKALVCLALVRAHSSQLELARQAADRVYQSLLTDPISLATGRFAYFLQLLGRAYAVLGDRERACDLYERTLRFAEEGQYAQVKAKALSGLAQLACQEQRFEKAKALHEEAIALLDDVGARCDLAEVHFQLGLTYRQMNDTANAKAHCERASHLFAQLPAPKQVTKVWKVFRTSD